MKIKTLYILFSTLILGQSIYGSPINIPISDPFANQTQAYMQTTLKNWKKWSDSPLTIKELVRFTFEQKTSPFEKWYNRQFTESLRNAYQFDCSHFNPLKPLPLMVAKYGVIAFCLQKQAILLREGVSLFAKATGSSESDIGTLVDRNLLIAIQTFGRRAMQFDAKISRSDIFQAGRNVWAAAALQQIFSLKAELTPSIFGYSMLYPYTDNLIDDSNVSSHDKKQFMFDFASLLIGHPIARQDPHLLKVSAMVDLIYNQYPIAQYPDVQQSLLTIFKGQLMSTKQSDAATSMEEIKLISAFKGGASVLADAYLVKPDISINEGLSTFQFGYFLQLIDDLQDLSEDQKSGSRTLFNDLNLSKEDRSKRVLAMLAYGKEALHDFQLQSGASKALTNSIYRFIRLLTLEAVAKQRIYFSEALLEELSFYAPGDLKDLSAIPIEKTMYDLIAELDLSN